MGKSIIIIIIIIIIKQYFLKNIKLILISSKNHFKTCKMYFSRHHIEASERDAYYIITVHHQHLINENVVAFEGRMKL